MNLLKPVLWNLEADRRCGWRHLTKVLSGLTADMQEPLVFVIQRCEAASPGLHQCLVDALPPSERARLQAYRRTEDQQRFLLARGALRQLLGLVLGVSPTLPVLTLGPHGRPFCADGPEFSISHSGEMVTLAVHATLAVGVDVEAPRDDLDWAPIARRMFDAAEIAEIESLPEPLRPAEFRVRWCRLEAELKAGGWGIGAAPPRASRAGRFRHWALDVSALAGTFPDYRGSVACALR